MYTQLLNVKTFALIFIKKIQGRSDVFLLVVMLASLWASPLLGGYKSSSNVLDIGTKVTPMAMRISESGVGLGTATPAANLHVLGTCIIEGNVSLTTGNLSLQHPIIYSSANTSANVTIGDNTLVFVDTAVRDITATLPSPVGRMGMIYTIKQTSIYNRVLLKTTGTLLEGMASTPISGGNFMKLGSDGVQWFHLGGQKIEKIELPNPKYWWKMDDGSTTQSDAMGSAYSLNLEGGATSGNTGKVGGAVGSDGVDDWIRNTSFNNEVGLGNKMSLSFWLKYIETPMTKGNSRMFMFYNGSGNNFWVNFESGNTISLQHDVYQAYGTASVNANEWNHYTFTINGSTSSAYMNGAAVGSAVSFPSTNIIMNQFYINRGCCNTQTHGLWDEVRIYDSELSSDQVRALYQSY
jgi:hypothetical protein